MRDARCMIIEMIDTYIDDSWIWLGIHDDNLGIYLITHYIYLSQHSFTSLTRS